MSNLYALLLLISAAGLVYVAWQVSRQLPQPGQRFFILFLLATAFWMFGYSLQLIVPDQEFTYFWARAKWLGRLYVTPLWLIFVIIYTGPDNGWRRPPSKLLLAALLGIPILIMILIWTTGAHGFFWTQRQLQAESGFLRFMIGEGPLVVPYILYATALRLVTLVILVHTLRDIHLQRRYQNTVLALGTVFTLLISAMDISNVLIPQISIQLAPAASGMAAFLFYWVIYPGRLLDITPFTRSEIVESMSDGVIIFDAANRIIDFNPAAERLTGLVAAAVVGQPGETALSALPEAAVPYTGARRAHAEVPFQRGNQRLALDLTLIPLTDRFGSTSGRMVMIRDVTGEKQSAAVLRQALVRSHVLYQASTSLIAFENLSALLRNVVYAVVDALSAYWVCVIGFGPGEEQVITHMVNGGPGAGEVSLPTDEMLLSGLVGQALETMEPVFSPRTMLRDPRQGAVTAKWREDNGLGPIIVVPLRYRDRTFGAMLAANRLDDADFSHQDVELMIVLASQASVAIGNARLLETVQQYAAELEERNRELDAYSHTVAHDLKKPLTYMLGYGDLLNEDERLPADARLYAAQISQAAHKMNNMVENLLLLARLRQSETVLEPVPLGPVVQAAVERFADDLAERGVRLEIEPEMPSVLGNAGWLEEVYANLLSNAIKYIGRDNPDPWVAIRARQIGEEVYCEVCDNGRGIAPEDQKKLFKLFSRFHVDQAAGYGLGLSIVMRIITKLNGLIGVESAPGQGSTFWFTLPAAPPPAEPAANSGLAE